MDIETFESLKIGDLVMHINRGLAEVVGRRKASVEIGQEDVICLKFFAESSPSDSYLHWFIEAIDYKVEVSDFDKLIYELP